MKRFVPVFILSLLCAVSASASPANNALSFDPDARVTGLSEPSLTQFTIEFWIYLGYTGNPAYEGGIYYSDDGSNYGGVFIEPDHSLNLYDQNGVGYSSPSTLPLNTWVHVAFTYDGSSLNVYYNAVLKTTIAISGLVFPTLNTTIGYTSSTAWNFNLDNTSLDELRIWNVAKTQTQILNNKAHTLSLPQTGLLRYYTFNQGVGGGSNIAVTSLPDMTGNGTSGTLAGFTLTGTSSNWVSATPFALPLELLSFRAVTSGSEIKTSWSTANEYQVSKFEIERSGDGNSFEKVGSVAAQNSQANSYGWTDASPLSGNNYYRLNMVDIDGASTFSKVVMAGVANNTNTIKIYSGSGTARAFTVEIGSQAPKGNYDLSVYNMSGAMIYRRKWQQNGSSTQAIVLPSTVASGVYTIIVSSDSQRFTQRWVVE